MTSRSPTDINAPLETGVSSIDVINYNEATDSQWLSLAASNFTTARYYQDASLTTQWERNADHFNNKHYRRSVYNSRQYKNRSRLFRPLTRAAERSSSATFATAMFTNMDLIDVTPSNYNDPLQVASARIMKEILQFRLTKTIKWYLTCMGAWQDTRVYGPCCTYTTWDYIETKIETEVPEEDVMGKPIPGRMKKVKKIVVLKDEPRIDMIPVENLLLDPQCDWRDPIGTSPYVIRLVPMHLDDVEAKMDQKDPKTGLPVWRKLSRGDILSASRDSYNTVRQAREGDNRPDKTDAQDRTEFEVVWAHENFVRVGGEEWVYWTLGTEFLLSDPTPLREVYHTGKRPLTYGFSVVETHKFSPSSTTELIAGLQTAVNDVANLRMDNIRLALNKRYIIRRGATVDLEALMRSVPGGGIMTDDPEKDIKVVETRDVTASSYREQERLETESNDISGTFMGAAVQNNQAMNKTVGGMELLAAGTNSISEMDIRTFVETWVKPQLELLIQYIQAYETDDVIFSNAFEEAFKEMGQTYDLDRLGLAEVADDAEDEDRIKHDQNIDNLKNKVLNDKMTINVNVGLGATSPQKKIELITYAISAIANMPDQVARLDGDEVSKEIFAAAGYQDGAKFIKGMGPGNKDQELTEADLQEAFEQGTLEGQDKHKMAAIDVQFELGMKKIQMEENIRLAEIASKEGITVAQLESKTGIERMKDKTRRDQTAMSEGNKRNELEYKRTTGKPGI